MDYKQEARELVRNLNERMGPSPYDIAWLARLKSSVNGSVRWPDLIDWLLNNQHADGSWGGQVVYYHERIICTLAAAIALRQNDDRFKSREAVQRAERYLWRHLHMLKRDPFELVGFELIFPTLLQEAQSLGLDVPNHTCGYGEIQTAKLRLIPIELLYSPRVSTVHSLEFLGSAGDPGKLRDALASNGSLGNSPAATAYYLLRGKHDDRALNYLEELRKHAAPVIYLYPFRTFELTWVLNNLAFCQTPITEFADHTIWETLQTELGPTGIGLDPTFGIPDGDITSVCSRLLLKAGYDFDPMVLARFEDKQARIFRTYDYERNSSVGTNVHALQALSLMPDYPNRYEMQAQIVFMLLNLRVYNMYWIDKWHASPYYATTHVLVGLLHEDLEMAHFCRTSVDWLLHTQREDGSWGFFQQGTAEETAYALIALLQFSRHESIDPHLLQRGAAYLAQAYEQGSAAHPELWIGKCLYIPYDVVHSVILAALILYEEMVGPVH